MSEDQLKAFLEAVKAKAGLQEQFKAAADADAVVAIAKTAGFVISADDLKQAQAEVSDEELEGVAGGFRCYSIPLTVSCCDAPHTLVNNQMLAC
ncbi:MAG: Nif11-like leader peptide family natural product precursor [Synechococcus sp.]|nr:Nif11-like leader peptide family natural product precursor [Synechococcus sp.]